MAVLGAAGDNGHGFELAQALDARGISAERLVRSPLIATFTYTKLLNSKTLWKTGRASTLSTSPSAAGD